MRSLIIALLAAIPVYGEALQLSVTCNGMGSVVYSGNACQENDPLQEFAEATVWGVIAQAALTGPGVPEGDYSSFASMTGDLVLTVTGMSGFGYFQPSVSAAGDNQTGVATGGASASMGVSGMPGCGAEASGPNSSIDNCSLVPFDFGTPQILSVSAEARAEIRVLSVPVSAEFTAGTHFFFSFFDADRQPLSGVSYTLVPAGTTTPEPATVSLTAIACLALIAGKQRRRN